MKNILFSTFFFSVCTLLTHTLQAQTSTKTNDEAMFKAYLKEVYDAYEKGDNLAMFAYYTENAAEISPDGHLTSGKKALQESWAAFEKMTDAKPKFTYNLTSYRYVTPDVAIITWDSDADIKIGGQQIGGKAIAMAVLHKKAGRWLIEFDSLTPILEMPAQPADKN